MDANRAARPPTSPNGPYSPLSPAAGRPVRVDGVVRLRETRHRLGRATPHREPGPIHAGLRSPVWEALVTTTAVGVGTSTVDVRDPQVRLRALFSQSNVEMTKGKNNEPTTV